jgi:hypothetical protein
VGKARIGMSQRVVLDTNCVISALLFSRQSMAWLRHSWQNADITPLASKDTVNELMRVLAYQKFKLSKADLALLLADFLPYTETVIIGRWCINKTQFNQWVMFVRVMIFDKKQLFFFKKHRLTY